MRRIGWRDTGQSGRRWRQGIAALLLAALLAACGGDDDAAQGSAPALSLTDRLARYEASLLAETNWLWANMLYTQDHSRPDAARCALPDFDHQPVVLSETEREQDSAVATLDQLTYADTLLAQARAEWQAHCEGAVPSANAAAYLKSRLEPAYSALERARAGIEARRRVEARG